MKLAVIGTGKIVNEALIAIKEAGDIELAAIFARPHSRERGAELASAYDIPAVYTDYDELLDQVYIDTVYIGLINSAHYEYARRALEKGKNVILEKPFTTTLEEAEDLFRLADEKDCFIFEAITVLHNSVFNKMRETLPKLGTIRMMQANFSQYSSRYDRYLSGVVDPSFDPACLGGALRDINVYNIHFAVGLFDDPLSAKYYPNIGPNGVDTSGVLILEYDGFVAVCAAAKDSDSPCFVSVQGEKGYMRVNDKPNSSSDLTVFIRECPDGESHYTEEPYHRMTREFRNFACIIDTRDHKKADFFRKKTLGVMRVLQHITMQQSEDVKGLKNG